MNAFRPRVSGLNLKTIPSWLPAALAIVVVWVSIGAHLALEWRQANAAAIENTSNLARGFGENVNRSIEGVDQVLHILRNAYRADPTHFDLATLAPATDTLGGITVQISAVDRHGVMTGGNLPFSGRVDLSDRAHIKVHLESADDNLFISAPVIGRVSQKWSMQFTRKLFDQHNTFDGVLVMSLDPYALSRFYDSLAIGHGSIALVGINDGVVRARAPDMANTIGQQASARSLENIRSGAPSGTYHVVSPADGVERIFSYRRLDQYGLAVLVGLSTDEVFAVFHRDLRNYLVAGGWLTILIAMFAVLLVRARAHRDMAQEQLTATLENISQGIVMIDADGRVPVINHRAAELLGLPPEMVRPDLMLREIFDWQLAHGEYDSLGQAADGVIDLQDVAQRGTVIANTYERTRPNGQVLEVRTQRLPRGGAVRSFTDITHRSQHEQALKAARDTAEAASEARSRFLALISHELRTPLNGMIGMTGMLLNGDLAPRERRYAETLRDSGDNLLRIINDILDFSKLEAHKLEMESIPFALDQVLDSVEQLLQSKAKAKGLYFETVIMKDVPNRLIGDPGRLRQILLNLADNGLKFTRSGGVSITVQLETQSAKKARLLVDVRDTGIGIDPAVQSQLFQDFAQADRSIARRFGGTGLGLAICRKLIQQMGGEVALMSEVDVGTTFTFDIELAIDTSDSFIPAVSMSSVGQQNKRLRVLLAEDNVTNQMVATYWLEQMGHFVDVAFNGNEAIEAVCQIPYDLVLMDVMMPEKDGIAATRDIRAMPGAVGNIPIVALTANAFDHQKREYFEAGMDAFLAKPLKNRDLASLLQLAIDGKLRPVHNCGAGEAPQPLHRQESAACPQSTQRANP